MKKMAFVLNMHLFEPNDGQCWPRSVFEALGKIDRRRQGQKENQINALI